LKEKNSDWRSYARAFVLGNLGYICVEKGTHCKGMFWKKNPKKTIASNRVKRQRDLKRGEELKVAHKITTGDVKISRG